MRRRTKKRIAFIDPAFLVFLALALIAGALCYARGKDVFSRGVETAWELMIMVLPKASGAFLLSGFVQVLVPREAVTKWIGEGSGFKGIVIAAVAGIFTPGGPMISFPLLAALYAMGANISSLIAYLISWELLGLQRILIWELPLMGTRFTLLRFSLSLPLPLIAGFLAQKLASIFSGYLKREGESAKAGQ